MLQALRTGPPDRLATVFTYSDLTSSTESVLRCAARIARHGGAALHAIHGTGLIGAPLGEALPRLLDGFVDRCRAALDTQVRRCLPRGAVPDHCALRHELPWRALYAHAARTGPDLIVADPVTMTVRARAVSDLDPADVVRRIGAPLLIPRRTPPWPFRRGILLTGEESMAEAYLLSALSWLGGTPGSSPSRSSLLRVVHVAEDAGARREIAPRLTALVRDVDRSTGRTSGIRVRRAIRLAASAERTIRAVAEADAAEVIIVPLGAGARADEASFRAAVDLSLSADCALLALPAPRTKADGARPGPATLASPLAPREETASATGAL